MDIPKRKSGDVVSEGHLVSDLLGHILLTTQKLGHIDSKSSLQFREVVMNFTFKTLKSSRMSDSILNREFIFIVPVFLEDGGLPIGS